MFFFFLIFLVFNFYFRSEETHRTSKLNEFTEEPTKGKKTLNMIPSSQYSSVGLHQYKWQRTPYVPPTTSNQTLAPPAIVVDE